MSIIIEIEDDEVFVHRNYYHEACFPHWKEGDIHKVERIEERHKCWECQEWIEAEQEMQALDTAVDLDEQLEVNAQRQIDEQADQNYYAQCAAEGYDPRGHDRNCDCSECSGDKPVPGWPPTAQETVCYQQVMAKPDEF